MKLLFKPLIFILMLLWSVPAMAAPPSTPGTPEDIAAINTYINNIQTLVADFTQVAPDGSIGYGRFFLKRPGRFRWQYDPPIPLLIVGNGKTLIYHDLELDQVSHVPARDNLASILAKPQLDISKDVKLQKIERRAGTLRLTISDKTAPKDGSLTLVFTKGPVALSQLEVVDATGNMTRLSLNNLTYGSEISDKLFTVDQATRLLKRGGARK
jgi:outer membrane lipoprotein-sorting protein